MNLRYLEIWTFKHHPPNLFDYRFIDEIYIYLLQLPRIIYSWKIRIQPVIHSVIFVTVLRTEGKR